MVQITVTVATPGLMASDHIPNASKARNVNVASQQKLFAGVKSNVPSPSSELITPWLTAGGSKSEYEIDHPELISVASTFPVIDRLSSNPE